MFTRITRIGLLALAVVLGTAGMVMLERHHSQLQRRANELRRRQQQLDRRLLENSRIQTLLRRAQAGDADAERAIQAEVRLARAEVATLERAAAARSEKKQAQASSLAEALANNRDPEKGMVRIENFQNLGRGSPSAALQTLVWAAVKGDNPTLASTLALSDEARARAGALIAGLPEDSRSKYQTPEDLAALAAADMVLSQTAIEITGQTNPDPSNATLNVNGLEGGPETLSLHLGADGWQLTIPDGAIKKLVKPK